MEKTSVRGRPPYRGPASVSVIPPSSACRQPSPLLTKPQSLRVIQNSVTKIANGPLTCADSGGEMPAEGVLNNPQLLVDRLNGG